MGLNDKDAPRSNWQLNKEPLELNNEEKEHLAHVAPIRYISETIQT